MAWQIGNIERFGLDKARMVVEQSNAPRGIKDYLLDGLKGLEKTYGADVLVQVDGYGHVCAGAGSFEVTTATIDVRRAE